MNTKHLLPPTFVPQDHGGLVRTFQTDCSSTPSKRRMRMMMMMIMASFMCKLLVFCIICMTLQEGCVGLPVSGRPVQASHPSHIRTKRCSCNSWEDKECIYFCHLDIIWVNTPSKLLPYGLGSPGSRRRRAANRCECLNPADKSCRSFCRQRSEEAGDTRKPAVKPSGANKEKLLAAFRSAVKSNMASARSLRSSENGQTAIRKSTNRGGR